jgi:hypothetical protein
MENKLIKYIINESYFFSSSIQDALYELTKDNVYIKSLVDVITDDFNQYASKLFDTDDFIIAKAGIKKSDYQDYIFPKELQNNPEFIKKNIAMYDFETDIFYGKLQLPYNWLNNVDTVIAGTTNMLLMIYNNDNHRIAIRLEIFYNLVGCKFVTIS